MENALPAIALLACPIGMALMMWFMGRSSGSKRSSREPAADDELRSADERPQQRGAPA